MYADNLVLFGAAEKGEIRELLHISDAFRRSSGLEVNPTKSTIWFSNSCDEECRSWFLVAFHAKLAQTTKKYLDVFISKSLRRVDPTHKLLVDNSWARLDGWGCYHMRGERRSLKRH
jgi:hypothetical protein